MLALRKGNIFNLIGIRFLKTYRLWLVQEFRRYCLRYLYSHVKY